MKLRKGDQIYCKRTSEHIGIEKGKSYEIYSIISLRYKGKYYQVLKRDPDLYFTGLFIHKFSEYKLSKYFCTSEKELRKLKLDELKSR